MPREQQSIVRNSIHKSQAQPRTDLLYKDEVYKIVGVAIEVHRELGPGFLEAVYQEALEIELAERDIPFESQKPLKIKYKSRQLKKEYVTDLVCYGKIVVELKAMDKLSSRETAKVLNYLKAAELRVGLIFNFGSEGILEWERRIK